MKLNRNRTEIIISRITDHISGELDQRSESELEKYLESNLEAQRLVGSLRSVRRALQDDPTGFEQADLDSRQEMVSESLLGAVEELESDVKPGRRSPRISRSTIYSSFAVVAVLVMVALSSTFLVQSNKLSGRGEWNEHYTDVGVHATVRLTDGSSITLTPRSKIRYKEYGNAEPREIHLEGEAYFDVVASSHSPLTIITENSVTQVLGTRFSVREFDHEEVTTVAVRSGRVRLKPRHSGGTEAALTLSRGDVGHLKVNGVAIVDHGSTVDDRISWLDGVLTFNHSRLQDVLTEIERWYDLEMVVTDQSLLAAKLTGTLVARSRDEAIKRISEALNLGSASNGRVITLSPSSSPSPPRK